MNEEFKLNRMEFMILDTLYDSGCIDHFHSMTITELLYINDGVLGVRMTVYRKLKKLANAGYIEMGCIDNHAHTFYLLEKGIKVIEGGKQV